MTPPHDGGSTARRDILRLTWRNGVEFSTAVGWLRGEPRRVISADILDMDQIRLQTEVLKLRGRIHQLSAVTRLLLALVRTVGVHLDHVPLPEGAERARLLRAIGCAERVLSLQGALRVLRVHGELLLWAGNQRLVNVAE